MTARWNRDGRNEADWDRADLTARTHDLPLRQRLDVVLWGGVLLLLALLFGTLVFGLMLGKRIRWWEPPLVKPIEDQRVLANVQEQVKNQRIVDAAEHLGSTFVLREDGQVLRYQPKTQLWSEERPFESPSVRLTQLRSDAHDGSEDPSLWALTTGEGLARRDSEGWHMLFSNTAFVSLLGRPFTTADLTCAAISDDRTWLLVGTRHDGIGLYHIPDRSWRARSKGDVALRFEEAITRAVWYRDRFYFGGTTGLHWFDPVEGWGETLDADLALIDLDAAPEGLYILGRHPRLFSEAAEAKGKPAETDKKPSAADKKPSEADSQKADAGTKPSDPAKNPPDAKKPADTKKPTDTKLADTPAVDDESSVDFVEPPQAQPFDALYFARLTDPEQPPRTLLEEWAPYPELNQTDLLFACEKKGILIVAGRAGIYTYDPALRRWQRHHKGQVRHALTTGANEPVYFAGPGLLGMFHAGTALSWPLPGEDIVRLDALPSGKVLATTRNGGLYGLSPKDQPVSLRYNGTPAERKYYQGVAQGDDLLLMSTEGGLLHNTLTRSYTEIPKDTIPPWLLEPKTRLLLAGGSLHAIRNDNEKTELFSWVAGGGQIQLNAKSKPVEIPRPKSTPFAWGDKGFVYITRDGQVLAYDQSKPTPVTGPPKSELDSLTLLDAADWEGDLALATVYGLAIYNREMRAFAALPLKPESEAIDELASLGPQLFKRTESGRLISHESRQEPGKSKDIIGGGLAMPFTQAQISDAYSQGDMLLLAGKGAIARYDLALRRVNRIWDTGTDQPVTLLGYRNQPLATAGGDLFLGDRKFNPEAGRVLAAGLTETYLWTARERFGLMSLVAYPTNALENPERARVLYGNPASGPGATQFFSAVQLPSGPVVCATNAGLRIYSPDRHSWYQGPKDLMARGGQVYHLHDHLFFVERLDQEHERVSVMPTRKLILPNNGDNQLSLDLSNFLVRSFALSPGREAAWLRDDGGVERWRNGKVQTLFSASGKAPASGSLQCVHRAQDQDRIYFAGSAELWSYQFSNRQWERTPLVFDGRPFEAEQIQIENGPDGVMLNARRRDGALFCASLDTTTGEIPLLPLASPSPHYLEPGFRLLDVQGRPNALWAFVFADRVAYYDPHARQWVGEQRLPLGTREVTLTQSAGLDIIQADTGWLIAQDYKAVAGGFVLPSRFTAYTPNPGDQTAIDSNRQIWRLTPDGQLLRGRMQDRDFAFTRVAGPGLTMPAGVRQAFAWGTYRLLETADRLLLLDTESDSLVPLAAAERQIGINQALAVGSELWLINGAGLTRLMRVSSNVVSRLHPGVSRVMRDAANTPWALVNGAWQIWKDGAFAQPWLASTKMAWQARETFVVEGAQVTALDASGRPYFWNNGFAPGETVFDAGQRQGVEALFRGRERDWWLVKAGTLIHLSAEECGQGPKKQFCLRESGRTQLPASFRAPRSWRSADVEGRNVLALVEGKRRIEIAQERSGLRLTESAANTSSAPLADLWPQMRQHLVADRQGQLRFNPIKELRTDRAGRLLAVRHFGEQQIANRGDIALLRPKPLDCTWLRWDRDKQVFIVQTDKGPLQYRPEQFVREGRLLFEEVAALTFDERGLHVANKTGIWSYPEDSLAVDDPRIRLKLIDLGRGIRAAHGHFFGEFGDFDSQGRAVTRARHEVAIHDLVLRESSAGITASIGNGRTQIPALGAQGFVWDSQRLGVAYDNERLLVQSALGFQPAEGLFSVEPGPLPGQPGNARTARDGSLYLEVGGAWFQRSKGTWVKASNPNERLPFFDDGTWSWRAQRGQLRVTRNNDPVPMVESDAGIAFSADLLKGAIFSSTAMVLTTGDGLRITSDPAQLVKGEGSRLTLAPGEEVISLMGETGVSELYRVHGAAVARWDGKAFTPSANDPRRQRKILELRKFRVHKNARGVNFAVVQDTPGGAATWQPVSISGGRFPFDRVTAIATTDTALYVGTPIGLQIYQSPINTSLRAKNRHLDLRELPDDPPAQVIRMGKPQSQSSIWVKSTGIGLEIDSNGGIQKSARALTLSKRVRVEDALWRWSLLGDGSLIGRYDDGSGNYPSPPIDLTQGRLPHDRLTDLIFWKGDTYALWDNGWVTESPGATLSLGDGARHFDLTRFWPNAFAQIPTGLGEDQRFEGLYLKTIDGGYLHRQANGWVPIGEQADRARIAELVSNQPIYLRGRLRMQREAPLRFEFLDEKQQWRELPWQDGKVAIDHWRSLVNIGKAIWVATPAGLLRLNERDGTPQLDPDHFELREQWSEALLSGPITDLRWTGKRLNARVAEDGKRLYQAPLDAKGRITAPMPLEGKDPFDTVTLIHKNAVGRWRWELVGRSRGRPGSMRITKNGEAVNLLNGKFDFDTLNSVALCFDGQLDLCTDRGGWYRTPRESFHVADLTRVELLDVEPTRFDQVALGHDDRGKVLALRQREGNTLMVGKGTPREVQGFSEFLGEDNLWRYFKRDGVLTVVGRDGLGQRAMVDGRFTDDIVQGFPQRDQQHTWIPTRAGVQVLDRKLVPERLLTAPFAGLPDQQAPSVLLRFKGKLVYAGEDAFHDLADPRPAVAGLGIAAPDPYELERVAAMPDGGYQAQWRHYYRRGFTRLRGKDLVTYPANQLYVHIGNLDDFISHRIAWGNPDPWLAFNFASDPILVTSSGKTLPLFLPDRFALVNLIHNDKHLYLIGEHHLLQLDLEILARRLYATASQQAQANR